MAKRKVIQITGLVAALPGIVALCDDGTLWIKQQGQPWQKGEDVPQDEALPSPALPANPIA